MPRPNRRSLPARGRGGLHRFATGSRCGLTLIELLVTAAIVGILAGIAMANFQRAQVQAKVSAGKSQLRTLAGAVERYCVDYGTYPTPAPSFPDDPFGVVAATALASLTTPVAYIAADALRDPFGTLRLQAGPPSFGDRPRLTSADPFRPPTPGFNMIQSLLFFHYPRFSYLIDQPAMNVHGYASVSVGPDRADSFIVYLPFPSHLPAGASHYGVNTAADTVYDPTNGTVSGGDMAWFGGQLSRGGLIGGAP
ncbi:MAG: Type II secretion system protein G precursor [candidate division BRC1 bacterium ADurb.BinA292]|nr:MAG: Type II secretion system protein G precursor [candidate division BRC1 bacterium ADurb.BinA292]